MSKLGELTEKTCASEAVGSNACIESRNAIRPRCSI